MKKRLNIKIASNLSFFSRSSLSLSLSSQAKPQPTHNPCLLFLQSQPLSLQVHQKMPLQESTALVFLFFLLPLQLLLNHILKAASLFFI
jgi:hypothetical protein